MSMSDRKLATRLISPPCHSVFCWRYDGRIDFDVRMRAIELPSQQGILSTPFLYVSFFLSLWVDPIWHFYEKSILPGQNLGSLSCGKSKGSNLFDAVFGERPYSWPSSRSHRRFQIESAGNGLHPAFVAQRSTTLGTVANRFEFLIA